MRVEEDKIKISTYSLPRSLCSAVIGEWNDDEAFRLLSLTPLVSLVFLVGFGLGQEQHQGYKPNADHQDLSSSTSLHSMHSIESIVQVLVIPTYTVLVVLYLTALYFRKELEPLLDHCYYQYCYYYSASTRNRKRNNLAFRKSLLLRRKPSLIVEEDVVVVASPQPLPPPLLVSGEQPIEPKEQQQQQPFDLTGSYQLVSNDNFDGFLAAQGVPWVLRSAANKARPIHRLTHRGCVLTIKIEGIIESQTTYIIHGPPVETNVRGRLFEDTVVYLEEETTTTTTTTTTMPEQQQPEDPQEQEDDQLQPQRRRARRGIRVHKKAITENYDITVQRELSEDSDIMYMTSIASFRDGRPPVTCKQVFHRIQ